ncbi:uncharacterized protein LOC113790865 isoform X2 [Dermatophagoides pteronyssinus]|uniref:uncharacterized protein LOC113790865 isoform X2 n=1 Tax=Dermatophagoides pteronyssinus TaxID=6956 RepID=UPI003F6753CB
MLEIIKYYSYGILSNIICILGLLGNTITLYILNSSKDMRKSTINIYLTVLTLYDNGVLIFSVLMLNIPSIADYQLQQLHEQQMLATVVANISFINDTNCLGEPPPLPQSSSLLSSSSSSSSMYDIHKNESSNLIMTTTTMKMMMMMMKMSNNGFPSNSYISSSSSSVPLLSSSKNIEFPLPLSLSSPFKHHHLHSYDHSKLNELLNSSINLFVEQCLINIESVPSIILTYNCNITNRTNNDNSLYCNLLLRIKSYSNIENSIPIDRILQNCITKWSIQMDSKCFQILNKTLNILDHFNERKIIIPDKLLLFENHFTKLLLAAIKTNYNMTINDVVDDDYYQQRFCSNSSDWISIDDNDSDDSSNIECPAIDLPYSPLVYYVKIVYPLALFAQTGSIWTTCLITIERYLAVCHPLMTMTLSTRARAIWALTLLSIVAFLFNLPRFAEVDTTCYQVRPTEFRHNKIYYQVYYIFLNLTFNYIIPLSLLAALNVKIYLSVQQASQNRSELTRARQSELHLASMFIAIVAIFIACNAPAFLCNCLEPYFKVGTPVLELMTIFANVLVCINSSINFVIYCIFGRKFRSKFLRLLRIDQWCRRQNHHQQQRPLSYYNNSQINCTRSTTIPLNHRSEITMNSLNNDKNSNNNDNQQHYRKHGWTSLISNRFKIGKQPITTTTASSTSTSMTTTTVRFLHSKLSIRSNNNTFHSNQKTFTVNHDDDDNDENDGGGAGGDDDDVKDDELIAMMNHNSNGGDGNGNSHHSNHHQNSTTTITMTINRKNLTKLPKELSTSTSSTTSSSLMKKCHLKYRYDDVNDHEFEDEL